MLIGVPGNVEKFLGACNASATTTSTPRWASTRVSIISDCYRICAALGIALQASPHTDPA
jgi:hypothetical protein